jgi:hypothetical protein
MFPVKQIIAAPFQHLELVVEAFHTAAGLPLHEIIGDLFPPVLQGVQEVIEALQFTAAEGFAERDGDLTSPPARTSPERLLPG